MSCFLHHRYMCIFSIQDSAERGGGTVMRNAYQAYMRMFNRSCRLGYAKVVTLSCLRYILRGSRGLDSHVI